ncbi:hypothetical protein EMCRGX_G001121 [Ephydatia muelleri]
MHTAAASQHSPVLQESLSVRINWCHVRGETQEPNALNGGSLAASPMKANLVATGTKKAMVQRLLESELPAGSSNHSASDSRSAGHSSSSESSSAGEQRNSASRSSSVSSATVPQHGALLTHCQSQALRYQPLASHSCMGIMLDSEAQILSLPQDKLENILHRVNSWLGRHSATKRELLSLIGRLSFASMVVPAGWRFLRRLIDLSTTVNRLHQHIRLSSEARADLA